MKHEFRKIETQEETRYVLEDATAGATSAGAIAAVDMPLGELQKREPPKPRNFVAKNAKMGGAGQHKDKKKAEKQGDVKHKKPFAEGVGDLGYNAQSLIMKLRRDVEEKRLQPTAQAVLAAARELAGDMDFAPQLLVKQVLGQGVAEGLDPDTQRLEQEVRDALANGDDYTAKSLVKMAQTAADRNYLRKIIRQEMYGTGPGQGGVAEGGYPEVDHMPGPTIKRTQTGCKRCHGKGYVYKTDDGVVHPTNQVGAKQYRCGKCDGIGFVKVTEQGVAEGVDIGQEWMSDTELDQYVPQQLQQQWRELLGYDRNGNPSALWSNLTGGYEPDVNDPQHRALMVKVANKWFAAKKIPNVKFFNVKDADDELEWLVQIGQQGVSEDHEIQMAGSELQSIAKDALQLLQLIKQYSEMDGLDAWQQSKITKAADYLNAVHQSISGKQGVDEAWQNDESNLWYIYDDAAGKLKQKMIQNLDEPKARSMGYRDSIEGALKVAGIIRSKFDPKKFVQNIGGKWVPVSPFGGPDTSEETYMESLEDMLENILGEKIPKGADVNYYIQDFSKSSAPQFRGKTKEKRKQMAVAAYYGSKQPKKKK